MKNTNWKKVKVATSGVVAGGVLFAFTHIWLLFGMGVAMSVAAVMVVE